MEENYNSKIHRSIVLYGAKILREQAQEVDLSGEGVLSPQIKNIIDSLFHLSNAAEGIGLAAPQIGESLRIFIVSAALLPEGEGMAKDFRRVCINPQLIWQSKELSTYEEGCLSIPGIRAPITRPKQVELSYVDEHGKSIKETFDDLPARVVQHEYDHLEGKLFIDYLSPLKRRLLKKKLNQIRDGIEPQKPETQN
ncbi:MAG: peptide deformylase [Cytophagales bacterium]|nr:peptide deformylase [Cytophagales bacterium]